MKYILFNKNKNILNILLFKYNLNYIIINNMLVDNKNIENNLLIVYQWININD